MENLRIKAIQMRIFTTFIFTNNHYLLFRLISFQHKRNSKILEKKLKDNLKINENGTIQNTNY